MSKPPEQEMAEAMLIFAGLVAPIGEAVDGYRADCERRGYSPTAAEQMALSYHSMVMAQIIGSIAYPAKESE